MTATHKPDVNIYFVVFGALMVMTFVTVAISWLHLPVAIGIVIGLAIATFKASLVAAFFMHLKGERALIYGLLAMTMVATAILFIIPITDNNWTGDRHIQPPAAAEGAEAGERH